MTPPTGPENAAEKRAGGLQHDCCHASVLQLRCGRESKNTGDASPPLRHQRRRHHGMTLIGMHEAAAAIRGCPHALRACSAASGTAADRPATSAGQASRRNAAAPHPQAYRCRRPPPSPARMRLAVPAPRHRLRARCRGQDPGNRSRRRFSIPGADRACRASAWPRRPRSRRCPSWSSWHDRLAVELAAVGHIAVGASLPGRCGKPRKFS